MSPLWHFYNFLQKFEWIALITYYFGQWWKIPKIIFEVMSRDNMIKFLEAPVFNADISKTIENSLGVAIKFPNMQDYSIWKSSFHKQTMNLKKWEKLEVNCIILIRIDHKNIIMNSPRNLVKCTKRISRPFCNARARSRKTLDDNSSSTNGNLTMSNMFTFAILPHWHI